MNCPEKKWDVSDVLQGNYMAICFMVPFPYDKNISKSEANHCRKSLEMENAQLL